MYFNQKNKNMKTNLQHPRKEIMWYKVRELFINEKLSKSEIKRRTGLDRATIRKYLSMSESEFMDYVEKRRSSVKVLDGYYGLVKQLLTKDASYSAAQIEDLLKERDPDFVEVNSKTVYNFVHYVRIAEGISKPLVSVRQMEKLPETAYGYEAQVDFGECWQERDNGSSIKVYFFAMVLSRSRYKFIYFQQHPFTASSTVDAHEKAFAYFEGIPKKIIYDQDKVLLKSENLGDYLMTDVFRNYRQQTGFEAEFCRKADPQSKGKIENVIGYVKKNFLRGRTFSSIDLLNEQALGWLERTANGKQHAGTKLYPVKEWSIEKKHLLAIKCAYYKPVEQKPYQVRKDNTISYRGNFYDLPLGTYQGRNTVVYMEVEDNHIRLYNQSRMLIAQHPVCAEKGKTIRNTSHKRDREGKLAAYKADVLKLMDNDNRRVLTEFVELVHKRHPRHLRDNLQVLKRCLMDYSTKSVMWALDFCIKHEQYNAYKVIEAAAHHQEQEQIKVKAHIRFVPRISKDSTRDMIPQKSSINVYENVIELWKR